jgi:2-isopropylmalate synthase
MPVQPNKAIVGANAFSHESGIHQDGLLKHPLTYEIIRPETIGHTDSTLVIGKHSGRHAFGDRVTQLGYELDAERLEAAFRRFKELAGKKREVSDADIEALIADLVHRSDDAFRLVDLQVVAGRSGLSTATVRILDADDQEQVEASVGAGPVDAVYRAIGSIVQVPCRLEEFRIHAVTKGIDAQGAVSVRISSEDVPGRIGGYGTDTDILVASAHAYINALNRLVERRAAMPDSGEAGSSREPEGRDSAEGELHERGERNRSSRERREASVGSRGTAA